MATTLDRPADLVGAAGRALGATPWLALDQAMVDDFANATGDRQWIHESGPRADQGPFGGPIIQGFLLLSLVNHFLAQLLEVPGASAGVNYGTERVRFVSPVPVGSRIRGRGEVTEVAEVSGGVQVTVDVLVEVNGVDRPACYVQTVSRFLE